MKTSGLVAEISGSERFDVSRYLNDGKTNLGRASALGKITAGVGEDIDPIAVGTLILIPRLYSRYHIKHSDLYGQEKDKKNI